MTPADLIARIGELGGRLYLDEGELRLKAPKGALSDELRTQLREQKAAIITFLQLAQTSSAQTQTTILPVDRKQALPASFSQQRLWFLDSLEPDGSTFNMLWSLRLRGKLNMDALQSAITDLVARHESLRTVFKTVDGAPTQLIAAKLQIDIGYSEDTGGSTTAKDSWLTDKAAEPFDLSSGPLLRVFLRKNADNDHQLLIVIHHIISDAWSMGILFHELTQLYEANCRGTSPQLPTLKIQYADFAAWQQDWLQGPKLDLQLAFWREALEGAPPLLELPTDRPRPANQTYAGAHVHSHIGPDLHKRLQSLAQQKDSSMFILLQAALTLLLARYSGTEDIVIGTPVAGRGNEQLEPLIGFFLNTLVLRNDLSGNPEFTELLQRVRKNTLDAFQHQELPFEKLVEELRPARELSHSPIFQVLFNLRTQTEGQLEMHGLEVEYESIERATAKTDLALSIDESSTGLGLAFEFNTDLFDRASIEEMARAYTHLLTAIAASPENRIGDLPLLAPADITTRQTTEAAARPDTDFQQLPAEFREQSIAACFADIAKQFADKPAACTAEQSCSYGELNDWANSIAHELAEGGHKPRQRAGLLAGQDIPVLAGIIGTLKAGLVYVPLDPESPVERHQQICSEADISIILTDKAHLEHAKAVAGESTPILLIDAVAATGLPDPNISNAPTDAAYVLFTSGSTGKPKGVIQNHRNVLHHCRTYTNAIHIQPQDRLSLLPPYGFDAAVMDIFGALLNGATLQIFDLRNTANPAEVTWQLSTTGVTVFHSTPTVFRYLFEDVAENDFSAVRIVVLGGEEARNTEFELFKKLFDSAAVFVNGLGPSESTLALQFFARKHSKLPGVIVPVGRPVDGIEIVLLDENGRANGICGELAIRSEFVTPGYWNEPEQNAAAFTTLSGTSDRLYRTGDQARYLPDGQLVFMGRKDAQIKLRGHRIEAGEIEAALLQEPDIHNCAVLLVKDNRATEQLAAYIAGAEGCKPDVSQLRQHLRGKLPAYMVPAAFVTVEEIPLTANGKLNRAELPEPEWQSDTEFAEPRDQMESQLADIWCEVLQLERVGINDDFFALGGHSLLATQLIARIREQLQIEPSLRSIFETPTISGFAESLATVGASVSDLEIPRRDPASEIPQSFAQQRLWFIDQFEPDSTAYNLTHAVKLLGPLEPLVLQAAIDKLVARHASLRTIFASGVDGEIQIINEATQVLLEECELPGTDEAKLSSWVTSIATTPFDLQKGPLIRFKLAELRPSEHVLVMSMHHIISDMWSLNLLWRDLTFFYNAKLGAEVGDLPGLTIDYADYSVWQRNWLSGKELDQQFGYWQTQLQDAPALLELPTDRPRPARPSYRGDTVFWELSSDTSRELRRLATAQGASMFMVLLAAFNVLLRRYSGSEDIVVGSPIAGRRHKELENLIGFFINTLVLRIRAEGNPPFLDLLRLVKQITLDAYDHQDLPFEKLVEELQPTRDMSYSPLFQVSFILQNAPGTPAHFEGLEASGLNVEHGQSKFDLNLACSDYGDAITGLFEFNTDIFDRSTVERMSAHFTRLLESVAADAGRRIHHLPMLADGETHQLLVEWNATDVSYPPGITVHGLFEQQAAVSPENIALWTRQGELSYAELNRRANILACQLIDAGAGPDRLIAISCERSAELIIGLLAILKSGSAYVPVDPKYPSDRIEFMLTDSDSSILLTQSTLLSQLPETKADQICLDKIDWTANTEKERNPQTRVTDNHLAYVIYTSGSTGLPKGVAIEHRNTAAFIQWAGDSFSEEELAGVLASTSVCFDLSVFEIFCTLGLGGRVVLAEDALDLPRLPAEAQVTLVNTVPSAIAELVRSNGIPESVLTVNLAGEPLTTELSDAIYTTGTVQNVNDLYGPSEDTTYSTWTRRAPGAIPTIGKPIHNTQAYILDGYGQLLPSGIPGELYLGGSGVSRGYLGRRQLTAEKYVPDNFRETTTGHLYRTGDRVRHRQDGTLEFLGRIDHQIKLRGFRIELGEIESNLRENSLVADTVVMVREDTPGDQRLVAYVTAASKHLLDTDELRKQLRANLPDFMVPGAFVCLDAFPLTPNGKVDRKKLPAPEWRATETFEEPRNELEKQLAEIWSAVLKLEQVGIRDDFFELGGHSLLAMQLVSRIRDQLNVELPLAILFEQPCIADLAKELSDAGEASLPIEIADRSQPLPMSFAQQRQWFLDVMQPGTYTYNVPWAAEVRGAIDTDVLQQAVGQLVQRHESLRTTFGTHDEEPVQIIAADCKVVVEHLDLSEATAEKISATVTEIVRRPFDLQVGPLLRVALLSIAYDRSVLVMCMHHIISDAWSQSILVDELGRLYSAIQADSPSQLTALPLQYADYAVWQRSKLTEHELDQQLAYWKTSLGGAPPLITFPLDKPRPALETHNGRNSGAVIDRVTVAKLEKLTQLSGNTMFTLLLAAFNVLLARYSGETDLVVGTPVSGRNRTELEGIVGFFLNTLAVRTEMSGNPSFNEVVARVRDSSLQAFAHQDLPFERLVEELQPERNLSHAPLFQVLFVFTQSGEEQTEFAGLPVAPANYDFGGAKFDLQLTLHQSGANLSANALYNTDLFEQTTIDRILAHFTRLLDELADHPERGVEEIQLLDEQELSLLTDDFNATAADYPATSVVDLVAAQVAANPDDIALVADQGELSYQNVRQRSNSLAHHLSDQGIGPGSLVAICAERGPDIPVAILAVLKTGAAYVPVDPAYPAERISYMLDDSQCAVILSQSAVAGALPEKAASVLCLDEFDWAAATGDLQQTIDPQSPAYAIYTSGSTGKPKGVLLPHAGLANLIQWQADQTSMTEAARTLQFASFSFDVSFQEVFTTWQQGGTLVMINDELRRDLPTLAQFIADRDIERLYLPFAAFQPLTELMNDANLAGQLALRDVVVAGEQLQITPAIRKLFAEVPGLRLHNQYGPSETHVVTAYTLEGDTADWPALPPIGTPIANTQVYALDEQQQPTPIGVPGELYIGGVQVGLGYLQRAELTAEKFIADPFRPSQRLYRTGDKVRFLADGNLEYLGRTDDQVKWRGFRIEPGEIETTLAEFDQVSQAAVLLREDDPDNKQLVAYLVAEDGAQANEAEIRTYVRARMPDYMAPSAFVFLDAMPLTPSGKIARRMLPAPAGKRKLDEGSALPTTAAQLAVEAIWMRLLKVNQVALEDNFFDLGGHSLLTIKLIKQVEAATGEQLTIADVFENPTLEDFSALLADAEWADVEIRKPGLISRLWTRLTG